MKRPVDLPKDQNTDPVVGECVQRITIDFGPPAAVAVVFVHVRESGAVAVEFGERLVQVGDRVPDEMVEAMPAKMAAAMRAGEDRSVGATSVIARIMKEDAITELVAELKAQGMV